MRVDDVRGGASAGTVHPHIQRGLGETEREAAFRVVDLPGGYADVKEYGIDLVPAKRCRAVGHAGVVGVHEVYAVPGEGEAFARGRQSLFVTVEPEQFRFGLALQEKRAVAAVAHGAVDDAADGAGSGREERADGLREHGDVLRGFHLFFLYVHGLRHAAFSLIQHVQEAVAGLVEGLEFSAPAGSVHDLSEVAGGDEGDGVLELSEIHQNLRDLDAALFVALELERAGAQLTQFHEVLFVRRRESVQLGADAFVVHFLRIELKRAVASGHEHETPGRSLAAPVRRHCNAVLTVELVLAVAAQDAET